MVFSLGRAEAVYWVAPIVRSQCRRQIQKINVATLGIAGKAPVSASIGRKHDACVCADYCFYQGGAHRGSCWDCRECPRIVAGASKRTQEKEKQKEWIRIEQSSYAWNTVIDTALGSRATVELDTATAFSGQASQVRWRRRRKGCSTTLPRMEGPTLQVTTLCEDYSRTEACRGILLSRRARWCGSRMLSCVLLQATLGYSPAISNIHRWMKLQCMRVRERRQGLEWQCHIQQQKQTIGCHCVASVERAVSWKGKAKEKIKKCVLKYVLLATVLQRQHG